MTEQTYFKYFAGMVADLVEEMTTDQYDHFLDFVLLFDNERNKHPKVNWDRLNNDIGEKSPFVKTKFATTRKTSKAPKSSSAWDWEEWEEEYTGYQGKGSKVTTSYVNYSVPMDKLMAYEIKKMKPINVIFSGYALAQIFLLMNECPNIEWGAYLSYKEEMLNYTQLQDDIEVPFEMNIEKLLLYPQTTNSVAVDYIPDYQQFMEEFIEAKRTGYKTSALIHSHHTMGSFHSGTDDGHILDFIQEGNPITSTVASFNKKKELFDSFAIEDLINTEKHKEFLNVLNYDTLYAYPYNDEDNKYNKKGFVRSIDGLFFHKCTEEDIINAKAFVSKYKKMIIEVKRLSPTLILLEKCKVAKVISDAEFFNIKTEIFNSKNIDTYQRLLSNQLSFKKQDENKDKAIDILTSVSKWIKELKSAEEVKQVVNATKRKYSNKVVVEQPKKNKVITESITKKSNTKKEKVEEKEEENTVFDDLSQEEHFEEELAKKNKKHLKTKSSTTSTKTSSIGIDENLLKHTSDEAIVSTANLSETMSIIRFFSSTQHQSQDYISWVFDDLIDSDAIPTLFNDYQVIIIHGVTEFAMHDTLTEDEKTIEEINDTMWNVQIGDMNYTKKYISKSNNIRYFKK